MGTLVVRRLTLEPSTTSYRARRQETPGLIARASCSCARGHRNKSASNDTHSARTEPDTRLWTVPKEDVAPEVCHTPSGRPTVYQTLPEALQRALRTPRGRDVLLYPERATRIATPC